MKKINHGTQTLERGLDCLFALAQSTEPLTIPELAGQVRLPESTVYRLLRTLEERGLVERTTDGNRVLGPRVLELARSLRGSRLSIRDVARPLMQQLADTTKETVNLTVLSGTNALCIEAIDSPQRLRLSFETGRSQPLYAGASAKILLAFQDKEYQESVLAKCRGHRYTNGKVIDPHKLRRELERIREQGYVVTSEEVDLGATGVSAPIWFNENKLAAGLTLAGPKERLSEQDLPHLIRNVVSVAQQISDRLGMSL